MRGVDWKEKERLRGRTEDKLIAEETIPRVEVVARDNVAAGRSRGHFLHNALFVVECGTQYGDVLYVFQCQHKD